MFIIERMISLAAFALAIFVFSFVISKTDVSKQKIVLGLYLAVLCVFAFIYKPYTTADLYRLRIYMEEWIDLPLNQIFSFSISHQSPSWVLFSYFLNKLGNINFIQTFSCLWGFGNIFYIIDHSIKRQNVEGYNKGYLLFFVMAIGAIYLQLISGIRTILGFSVFAFCVFRELYENKKIYWHIPLYIFAALLHPAALIACGIRLIFLIFQQNSKYKRIGLFTAVLVGVCVFSFYGSNYFFGALLKAISYLKDENEYSYIWETIIGIIELVRNLFILYILFRLRKQDSLSEYKHFYVFTLIFVLIGMIFIPFSYAIFRRFTLLGTIMCIGLFALILQNENVNKKSITAVNTVNIILFLLSFARGDICGYKFFVL